MSKPRHLSLFLAALIAGFSYFAADRLIGPGALHVVWKGSGVALLAIWAALNARGGDGWLLALVMALGAAGDVLLETHGLAAGGAVFLAGHLAAITLYLRNRRPRPSGSQRALAIGLLIATPLVAWLLARDAFAAVYAAALGAMAATAWLSRFPRYRVGIGAVLFVISDWLILARAGGAMAPTIPNLLVWPTYFAAQALIAWGVVATLRKDRA